MLTDTERLTWLEQHHICPHPFETVVVFGGELVGDTHWGLFYAKKDHVAPTLRAAIDAAMEIE